jgi:hypothetical protein
MRAAVLRRVRPLADAQLGVVTSGQLRAAGVDLELPRREGWLRLADGLWLVHDDPTDEQLMVALGLYAPGALPSGRLACRWLGLRHAPDQVGGEALVQHGRTLLGGPLLRLRQSRRMPSVVEHRSRTVVPAVRAVADAGRWTSSLRDVRAVVLAALADRRVELDELRKEVDAGARRTSGRLQRSLQDWDRGARSAPEAEAADALLALPGLRPAAFLLNPEIWLDGHLLGSPDGWLVEAGLGWEMDSVEFHGDADDLDATFSRHLRFSDAGLELLHATPARMRAGRQAWASDVVARATRRVDEGWTVPSGLTVVPRGPVLGVPSLRAA